MLAEEIPPAIQWHEGMLLAPQHFQQSSLRQEMLTQYSTLLVGPYCWGVRRLVLDAKLLPSGTVRILEMEAILPDGSVAVHSESNGQDLLVQIDSSIYPRKQAIPIYLAVPARSIRGVRGALSRYEAAESSSICDENTGEDPLVMPVLRPRLSLFAGECPPPKFVSMPVAKVRFEDDACVQTDFIPPSTCVKANSPLGELCAELASRVREKAVFISEQVRAPSAVLDKPLMLENTARLQALVSSLPVFEALLSSGDANPLNLYLAICGMIGGLSSLGSGVLPPIFTPYNHSDLRASFDEVVGFALRMVNEGVPETYTAHAFQLEDRAFSLTFSPAWRSETVVLALRVPTGATEKDIIQWGEECLIGSESVVASLRERRIRGAQRQFVEKYQDLVPVRGVVLFSLRSDQEFIRPGEKLQVFNFGEKGRAVSPLEVVLYVRRQN